MMAIGFKPRLEYFPFVGIPSGIRWDWLGFPFLFMGHGGKVVSFTMCQVPSTGY